MPAGEGFVAPLARAVGEVYEQAELELLRLVAREVERSAAGIPTPEGLVPREVQAQAVARLNAGGRRIVDRLIRAGLDLIRRALGFGYTEGIRQADRELSRWLDQQADDYRSPVPTAALAAFTRDLAGMQQNRRLSILRDVEDAYRDAVARTVVPHATGARWDRMGMARAAMRDLADRGIGSFTDRSGRTWQLPSYIEMATRTAAARVMVQAQTDRLASVGEQYVYVSNHLQECERCRPYEHRVLAISPTGRTGQVEMNHALGEGTVTVEVVATLQEARLRGLMHPSCRHTVSLMVAGVTKLEPDRAKLADEQGDRDRQKLRYLERQVRHWRRREAAAVTPAERREARDTAAAYQARIRQHVADTGLMRQAYRERPDLGMAGERQGNRRDERPRDLDRELVDDVRQDATPDAADVDRDDADLVDAVRDPEPDPEPEVVDDEPDMVDPGGDPADLTDDQLDAALAASVLAGTDEAMERFEVLSAEQEAREAQAAKREAKRERDRARRAREREQRDADRLAENEAAWERAMALIDEGWDEQEAEAEARGVDVEEIMRRDVLIDLERQGYRGGWDKATRAAFELELQLEYQRAEDATKGAMLNKRGRANNVDPKRLLYGSDAFARANAAEELLAYWDENGGRLTLEHFRDRLLYGVHQARRMHGGREDYHQ